MKRKINTLITFLFPAAIFAATFCYEDISPDCPNLSGSAVCGAAGSGGSPCAEVVSSDAIPPSNSPYHDVKGVKKGGLDDSKADDPAIYTCEGSKKYACPAAHAKTQYKTLSGTRDIGQFRATGKACP